MRNENIYKTEKSAVIMYYGVFLSLKYLNNLNLTEINFQYLNYFIGFGHFIEKKFYNEFGP